MSSPYARSKQMMEKDGYFVGRTEHWNSFVKIRQDLFGIIDMVCVKGTERGVLALQPTSGDNASKRLDKALENKVLPAWLQAGNRFEVHGWRKVGERGKRKLWECRKINVTLDMFKTKEEAIIHEDHREGPSRVRQHAGDGTGTGDEELLFPEGTD